MNVFDTTKEYNKKHTKKLKNEKSHNYCTYVSKSYHGRGGLTPVTPCRPDSYKITHRDRRHNLKYDVKKLGDDVGVECVKQTEHDIQRQLLAEAFKEKVSARKTRQY